MYDFEKYKRVFAFGCSFTGYKYPTWANIMDKHIKPEEFYNFARSGGGNTFIANRITEANRVFKFCETDLIMVMWSTFCREDRYVPERGGWVTPGNIYSQAEYDFTDQKYLALWAEPLTYLIRDLSTIDTAMSYIGNLSCDSLVMASVPFSHQQDLRNPKTAYLLELYQDLENSLPKNMFDLEMNGVWTPGSKYTTMHDENFEDYHPSTLRYANYLKKIGIDLSDEAYTFAIEATTKLQSITHAEQFFNVFDKLCDPRLNPTELL